MTLRLLISFTLFCLSMFAGTANAAPLVIASNTPLAYMAKQLAGDMIDVRILAPTGEDPAFWTPTTDDIEVMQSADLILLNGGGFEPWLRAVSLRRSRLVDTSQGFVEQFIAIQEDVHSHGNGDAHSHGKTANVFWLDFKLAEQQADAVARGLIRRLKLDKTDIEQRFAKLKRQLSELQKLSEQAAEKMDSFALAGSHPVYHYFAKAYGLDVRYLHWEAAEEIDATAKQDLADMNQERTVTGMIFEFAPSNSAVQAWNDFDATAPYFLVNPLVNADLDYFQAMKNQLLAIIEP